LIDRLGNACSCAAAGAASSADKHPSAMHALFTKLLLMGRDV
jgi:hypothetical protein